MPRRSSTRFFALAGALALGSALAGCQTAGPGEPAYPTDLRDRHPLVLADQPRVLDLFLDDPRGFSERQRRDLAGFLSEYRQSGRSALLLQAPAGLAGTAGARDTVNRIRQAAGPSLRVSTYEPADPKVASAFRLSFRSLQAKVASQCGLWPQDLGVEDYEFNQANLPYWNHGCAVRSNFAAQLADPVDLVRGRQTTPADTMRRMNNIEKLRAGSDPSTNYKTESMSVRSSVSQ